MTFIQKLVLTYLPQSWSNAIQAESESWLLRCSTCGTARSVWEMGGIRFKASSVGKMVWGRCPQCAQNRKMTLERKG